VTNLTTQTARQGRDKAEGNSGCLSGEEGSGTWANSQVGKGASAATPPLKFD